MDEITITMTNLMRIPNFQAQVEKQLENVSDHGEFSKIREEWNDVKNVLDFMAKQLSSFPDSAMGQVQYPILNLDELPENERNIFPSVARNLVRCGVISYARQLSSAVITSTPAREILSGKNIKIESRDDFEKYRRNILAACSFIEREGKRRFIKLSHRNARSISDVLLDQLNQEIDVGLLIAYSDGSIKYADTDLELRPRLKDLCRLFMKNVNRLITIDDIKDQVIDSKKRASTPAVTIAKYVSDLHGVLKVFYKKEVIFNQKKEGWRFSPNK